MAKTNHRKLAADWIRTAAAGVDPEMKLVDPDPTNPYAFVVTLPGDDGKPVKFRVVVKAVADKAE